MKYLDATVDLGSVFFSFLVLFRVAQKKTMNKIDERLKDHEGDLHCLRDLETHFG